MPANSLEPPYTLLVGQRLTIPRARSHTVARGDTVYGLSKRYGVSMTELSRANGLAATSQSRSSARIAIRHVGPRHRTP